MIYDITIILGENEAWHATEYMTWNSKYGMGDDCHSKFGDWLEFARDKYGKTIPEFDPEEWLKERDRVEKEGGYYKEEEEIYHNTFNDFLE